MAEDKPRPCGTCGGTGTVWKGESYEGGIWVREVGCGDCGGTGKK